jgi:Tfp pilus assembly protein PilN
MNERRQRMTWRLFALAIVLSSLLIAYFVAQYLMFENQTIQLGNNANYLSDLIKSVECQESLISDIRNIQTSNFTEYNMDNKY